MEQELKIKIEDLEFELDDYRTGKINQKRRNLTCVSEPGNYCNNNYNYNSMKKNPNDNIIFEKIKTENNINNKTIDKPISVNSNNNYLITKLKKENENLRLKLSKYEINNSNSNRFRPIVNKTRQKKIENAVRITKKILNNNKQPTTKSSNIFSNFANNTYTNNFYNSKDNKFKTNNNNSSLYSNINKNIFSTNTMATNSFVGHNKKNIKNGLVKSLSVFRSTSKNKSKNKTKKIIYDKIKSNYKKIHKLSNSNLTNFMEIKIKEKKDDNLSTNLNINNLYNSRMNTLNNNIHNNNVFPWKKKIETEKNNNVNSVCENLYNTDRKNTEIINSKSNSKERNTVNNNFIPNNEFNLTWSRFPKKSIETSFEHYRIGPKKSKEIDLNSKTKTLNNDIPINNNNFISNISKINSINNNININKKIYDNYVSNNNYQITKDVTPKKITINRRTVNNKKNKKIIGSGSNNISMKNIINIHQKNKKEENIYDNGKKINTFNNLHEGDIYVHKKKNSGIGIDNKNLSNKYNVTINNINNCNYFSLIQASIRPIKKIK